MEGRICSGGSGAVRLLSLIFLCFHFKKRFDGSTSGQNTRFTKHVYFYLFSFISCSSDSILELRVLQMFARMSWGLLGKSVHTWRVSLFLPRSYGHQLLSLFFS